MKRSAGAHRRLNFGIVPGDDKNVPVLNPHFDMLETPVEHGSTRDALAMTLIRRRTRGADLS